ncbi:hypothetical protein ABT120_11685 [Nonomuraea angiospora]
MSLSALLIRGSAADQHRPDVAVIDIGLPHVDGLTAAIRRVARGDSVFP